MAAEKKALATAKKAERESQNAKGQTNQQQGRKRNYENEPSLVEKFPRVSTVEGAASSVNTMTESFSDVVTVESNNTCCVCFAPFQGDDEVKDWVQCACKRWLHEDYMNEIVYDKYGRELFCPHCSL